jgi:hypothetical protein
VASYVYPVDEFVVGGAVGLIVRLRRTTDPVQRQQLRWVAWGAGVIAFTYVVAFIPGLIFGSSNSSWPRRWKVPTWN